MCVRPAQASRAVDTCGSGHSAIARTAVVPCRGAMANTRAQFYLLTLSLSLDPDPSGLNSCPHPRARSVDVSRRASSLLPVAGQMSAGASGSRPPARPLLPNPSAAAAAAAATTATAPSPTTPPSTSASMASSTRLGSGQHPPMAMHPAAGESTGVAAATSSAPAPAPESRPLSHPPPEADRYRARGRSMGMPGLAHLQRSPVASRPAAAAHLQLPKPTPTVVWPLHQAAVPASAPTGASAAAPGAPHVFGQQLKRAPEIQGQRMRVRMRSPNAPGAIQTTLGSTGTSTTAQSAVLGTLHVHPQAAQHAQVAAAAAAPGEARSTVPTQGLSCASDQPHQAQRIRDHMHDAAAVPASLPMPPAPPPAAMAMSMSPSAVPTPVPLVRHVAVPTSVPGASGSVYARSGASAAASVDYETSTSRSNPGPPASIAMARAGGHAPGVGSAASAPAPMLGHRSRGHASHVSPRAPAAAAALQSSNS